MKVDFPTPVSPKRNVSITLSSVHEDGKSSEIEDFVSDDDGFTTFSFADGAREAANFLDAVDNFSVLSLFDFPP